MKKNMGSADRVIRIVVALVIGALIFTGRLHGVLAVVLGVIAAAFLLTSLTGRCPGYIPISFSTRKEAAPAAKK